MPPTEHLNPDGLAKNPAFSQAISVPAGARTLYIGGQNAVDGTRNIVGKGDVKAQAAQAVKNLVIALEAGGAKLEHLVKLNIYLVAGQPPMPAFEAWRATWGKRENPPCITVLQVAGLANPEFLIEIDAIAAIS